MSSFENYNPEEVFENIKTILKMLINYPVALADPSADRGEEKLRCSSTDSESKLHRLPQHSFTDMQSLAHSSSEVDRQQTSMSHCRTSSRLPSFALEAAKRSGVNMDKPFQSGNELPCSGALSAPFIEENNFSTSGRINSNLINKVREFLDSSSGEENVLFNRSKHSKNNIPDSKYSLSSSSTDDEQHTRTKIDVKPRSPDLPSSFNTPCPLDASKHQAVRSELNTHDTIVCSHSENNDRQCSGDVPFLSTNERLLLGQTNSNQYTPETPKTLDLPNYNAPMRPVSCAQPHTHSEWVNNASSSSRDSSGDNHGICHALLEIPSLSEAKHSSVTEEQNFEGVLIKQKDTVNQNCSLSNSWVLKNTQQVALSSSSVVNAMSEHIPQYSNEDQGSCAMGSLNGTCEPMHVILSSTSKATEARSLSSNCSDQELTDALVKETLFHECEDDRTQIHDVWNNLNHLESTTGAYSNFPSPPSDLNTTLLEQQELTLNNDATRIVGNSNLHNKTSTLRRFNDIPQLILNARDITLAESPSEEMEKIKSADARQNVLTASNETLTKQHPLSSMNKNSQLSEKFIDVPSEHDIDGKIGGQQTIYQEDMKTMNARECLSLPTNQALLEQPPTCTSSFNENLQYSKKLANVIRQKKPIPPEYDSEPTFSEREGCLPKKLIQTSLGNPQSNEKVASNECCNPLLQLDSNSAKVESGPLDQKDQFSSIFNQIAKGNSQLVCHFPRHISTKTIESRALTECNESHSSVPTMKSQGDFSNHDEDTAIDSDGLAVSQNDEWDPRARNTDFSPSVQLFHSFRISNGQDVANTRPPDSILTNGNGSKSSRRRVLAPSFSFLAPKKDHKEKSNTETCEDPKQTLKTSIRHFPSNKTEEFQSKKTTDVMVNDRTIVSMSKNHSCNPTFDMSEFDFGLDDNDSSRRPFVESLEPSNNLTSPSCSGDDVETIKLKDQLKEHVLKLEELQQVLKKCPQRRRKRLPRLFDVHAHDLELETRIHDAEILLQKNEEMWKSRSNERELAYEKEMFHSADDNHLLGQFSQEMKKESVRNEIIVTQLKCKILELKIEQSQCEEVSGRNM